MPSYYQLADSWFCNPEVAGSNPVGRICDLYSKFYLCRKLLIEPWQLISTSEEEFEQFEKC